MIQFNLVPDVKLEFIKARRSKHMVLLVAAAVAGVSLTVFILLFLVVNVIQTKRVNDLNKDITKYTQQLEAIPDLNKILTVQNQLNSLSSLHDQKPAVSRLVPYMGQLTPANATISKVKVDFDAHTLDITGNADALSTINKYADTLKFTTYNIDSNSDNKNAFSDVVLASFATADRNNPQAGISYQLTLSFDPAIFDITKHVALVTPKIISTRSETEKPTDLFKVNANTAPAGQ